MDLRKRLANLDKLSNKKHSPENEVSSRAPLDAKLLETSLRQLKLQRRNSNNGGLWVREYVEEVTFPWGEIPSLDGFFTRASEASPDLEDILFLDTETTGLSGGTGTIAFLVGVGWFKNSTFISRQYFLPDFSHEYAMLADLTRLAEKFKVVMTFNGASFDLPLLRTRGLMNRLKDPCGSLTSWDLLVPGRRLWGRILPDCRQQTLEKALLKIERDSGDIDGALIPQTWFDFLLTGNGDMIARVLYHNQRDLLGMVGIFGNVLTRARQLEDNETSVLNWQEAWALGRVAEKARLQDKAAFWLERAFVLPENSGDGKELEGRFIADALRILKRQGCWLLVEDIIVTGLDCGLDESWLHREAAILYEHRLCRLELALGFAERCDEPARVERLKKKIRKKNEVQHG